jgi:hypothetical protein
MTQTTFALAPITTAEAAELRRADGPRYIADATPGYPCRHCLRDAEIGEELILVSHDPFQTDSAYRSASPIFVHAHECDAAPTVGPLPLQLTCRQLSVRSFDADAMMIDATIVDGSELAASIERFFDDPASDHIHVHNATRGCWATKVVRTTSQKN